MKKALFIAGGWDGHKPDQIVQILSEELKSFGFVSEIATTLDVFSEKERLATFDLISPCWTMGSLTSEQAQNLIAAVRGGVGLAGIHGGMGDAFRGNLDYEWMVGGHFVGHPHVGEYTVRIKDFDSSITRGLPGTFPYQSEQYYMLMDPAVHILADTDYVYEGRSCVMPVAWVRMWGKGRVFYSALGHAPEEFTTFPAMRTLAIQGLRWAAGAL
jgi:type 1 glutamine amidotransferase